MITVDQYHYIRMANKNYGKSIREIVRETGHARNTVRKALRGEEPGYHLSSPRRRPVMEPFEDLVDEWLRQDREMPRKQRHTAKRVFDRLVAEHRFQGSEPTVRRYVRKRKREMGMLTPEAMVPLSPEAAMGTAEVDWGYGNNS